MKRQLPSRLLEQQFYGLTARRGPLSEAIQLGAQLMLQKAVELEVTEFLGREQASESLAGTNSANICSTSVPKGRGESRRPWLHGGTVVATIVHFGIPGRIGP